MIFGFIMLSIRKIALIFISLFVFSNSFSADDAPKISVFFFPKDNCAAEVLKRINSAKDSVDVAMYYFTSRRLAQALVDAQNRRVSVKVYLDGNQRTEKFSKANYLTNNGISVKIKNNISGLMHNKFCVIDKKIVITGSFNWTVAADLQNDENLVIIESKEIGAIYTQQFENLWNGLVPDEMRYKDKESLEKKKED